MRNRELHDALRDFALDAASLLTHDQASGSELAYDVVEEPGRGPALYCYEALVPQYIAERWDRLRELDTYARAAHALGTGASSYLRVRGVDGADPGPALRAMLERLYENATELDFPEERFERVYSEVEGTLYADATGVTVIAPLPGLQLDSTRIELGAGLALVTGDAFDAPPEAVWPLTRRRGARAEPNALCVFDALDADELPLDDARDAFSLLVRRMRLYKRGAIGIGPLGWARAGGGVWQPFELDPSPRGHAEPWSLAQDEARELVEFLDLCARTHPGGAVDWALDRLEIGSERSDPIEAVTDYLLALRVLLGREGEFGETLALRVSALCAEEGERRFVERRVGVAFELEQLAISGRAFPPYLADVGAEDTHELVADVEGYARALLRDTYCGYLDQDLRRVADDLLVESDEPIEVKATDLRKREPEPVAVEERVEPTGEFYFEPEPEPEPAEADELSAVGAEEAEHDTYAGEPEPPPPSSDTAEIGVEENWSPPEPEPYVPQPEDGVTSSVDWGFDDDTGTYSAPV